LCHQNNYYGIYEDDYQQQFEGPIQTGDGIADHHRDWDSNLSLLGV